ncbi:MAG: nickel pincer cofactor biosynthesis protein LarC [Myxococcales bacterium]|nr:nickel pincer cofactor biosynthesis protein LarC [Myxococcales bacterium]
MTAAELRGAHLHFDCASGIAGDMTLGALIDLGVPIEVVREAIAAVGVDGRRLSAKRVVKAGIASVDVKVVTLGRVWEAVPGMITVAGAEGEAATGTEAATEADPASPSTGGGSRGSESPAAALGTGAGAGAGAEHAHHGVVHSHGDHAHHAYRGIRARIEGAALGEEVKRRALDIFDRVAVAEATLHGSTVEEVVFHEVGAIDSVVDIVGTAAALAYLAPASVSCAQVAMGHGTVRCAHGVLPVPSPAALEILRRAGGVMTDGGVARELTTPTGAAILAHAVTAWTPAPTGAALAVGWGAGDMDLRDRPNVVRVTVVAVAGHAADELWRVEANLDDQSPEIAAHAIEHALAAGAVDAWFTPITMKKGRPALAFAALVPGAARAAVVAAILRETSTIGVRFDRVERTVLARTTVVVETAYGPIPVKVARDADGAVRNAAPEHDACAAAAAAAGAPLKLVYAAAIAAWHRGA